MPREVTRYLCDFKCGTKAKPTLKQITDHEAGCKLNPELKTCSTCVHEDYSKDYEEHYIGPDLEMSANPYMVRICKCMSYEDFEKAFISQHPEEYLDPSQSPLFHIPPIKNCPFHELKIKSPQ